MKHIIIFTLLSLLCTGYGEDTKTPVPSTAASTVTTTIESTTPVNTDTTTNSPTSTLLPTTVPSTTQSPVPTTQTSAATTQTSAPTTPPATSTLPTTIGPVTTPAPPKTELGKWNVTDKNTDVICIRAELQIRFKIPVNGHFDYIAVWPNVTSDGSTCNGTNNTQVLQLTGDEYVLQLTFNSEGKTQAYLQNITLDYSLPDQRDVVSNDEKLYEVPIGNSYMCNSLQNVAFSQNVTMEVFQVHIQAYGAPKNTGFGEAKECDSDNKVDDIVPIAVGCALLGLVVVVLIAYFVGRRRSRQKGYQSV